MIIKEGFIITSYAKSTGPLFVAPHAFPAFHKPEYYQDQGTHYISNKLAEMCKSKALISTVSREQDIGVDLFRQIPQQVKAIEYYSYFRKFFKSKKQWTSKTFNYRKKFAFVAKDEQEYDQKKNIHNNFWNVIRETEAPIFFIHRQYLNPKNHPSIIDFVPFNHITGTKKIVSKLNKKYQVIFDKLFSVYIEAFFFKTQVQSFKVNLEKSSKMIFFDHKKPKLRDRIERFDQKLKKHSQLKLTVMRNFRGDPVRPIIQDILVKNNKPIIHIEISEFLCKNIPDLAVYIIADLVNGIKK